MFQFFVTASIICYDAKFKKSTYAIVSTFIKTDILDEDSITDSELFLLFLKVVSRDEKQILERNLEPIFEKRDNLFDVLPTN